MSELLTIAEDQELMGHFHFITDKQVNVIMDNTNYEGLISETPDPKILSVLVNGKSYNVKIKSALDELIEDMGLNAIEDKNAGDIFSPMPGLVVQVMVKEGEQVKTDQPLLILEAMKMENIIKANGNGTISEIMVISGQKIEKSKLLITIQEEE